MSRSVSFSIAVGIVMSANASIALALDGYWEAHETCASYKGGGFSCDAKNSYGGPDSMPLASLSKGSLVCGTVSSSAYLGRKVDSLLVVGRVQNNEAEVRFGSSFLTSQMTRTTEGVANISIGEKDLRWIIVRRAGGQGDETYTWDSANLIEKPWGPSVCAPPMPNGRTDSKSPCVTLRICLASY